MTYPPTHPPTHPPTGPGRRLLRGQWAEEMSVLFEVFEKGTGKRMFSGRVWRGGWVEEEKAVRTRCCGLGMGGEKIL